MIYVGYGLNVMFQLNLYTLVKIWLINLMIINYFGILNGNSCYHAHGIPSNSHGVNDVALVFIYKLFYFRTCTRHNTLPSSGK